MSTSTIDSPIAFILIDMQQCMADPGRGPRNNPGAEDAMARLLQAWRAACQPVVHVRHLSRQPASGFWPGQPGAAFQDRFTPQAEELLVDKYVTDAFLHSTLERSLRIRGISRLVLVGVSTNYSVEATARSAGSLGFDTMVVADATYTFDRSLSDDPLHRAETIHRASLNNIDGEYGTVISSAQAMAMLPRAALD